MKKIKNILFLLLIPSYLFAIDPSGAHAYVDNHKSIGEAGVIVLCLLFLMGIGGWLIIANVRRLVMAVCSSCSK